MSPVAFLGAVQRFDANENAIRGVPTADTDVTKRISSENQTHGGC